VLLALLLLVSTIAGLSGAALARRYPVIEAPPGVPDVREAPVAHGGGWSGARSHLDRTTATGLALTAALVTIAVAGLLIGLLAFLVRSSGTLVALDHGVGAWTHRHTAATETTLLNAVTSLGDVPLVPILAVVLAALEHRRLPSRWIVPFLAVVLVGETLLSNGLKLVLDRVRPAFVPVAASLGPSFPSGHSTTAAAFFAAAALLVGRRRSRKSRTVLTGVAVGLAVAVAGSRVLLDVHWLSDVIAGLLLGWAWFCACSIAFGGRLLEFGAGLPTAPAGQDPGAQPTEETTRERRTRDPGGRQTRLPQ